ncbi:MAG: NAD(+)/NADH kinase [Thermotogae bacterium]|nr:NAD(+)/NADH kinase [Thermotogota bacterium]
MRVGIVFNPTIPGAQHESTLLEQYLRLRGAEIAFVRPVNEIPDIGCDTLMVMGGDGSMLQVAHWLAETGIPALGIKQGRLGFLMAYGIDEYEVAIDALVQGKLQKIQANMLEVLFSNGKRRYVLNDFVLERFSNHRTIEVEVQTNEGDLVFLGDGVVVSSPIGSTAYNLAAGGAVVCPTLKIIQITPLNPHGVMRTSVLLPGDSSISLRVLRGTGKAVFDGISAVETREGFSARVRFSSKVVTLLKSEKHRFFEVLKAKFSFGKSRMD